MSGQWFDSALCRILLQYDGGGGGICAIYVCLFRYRIIVFTEKDKRKHFIHVIFGLIISIIYNNLRFKTISK